jgi:hypothetical protein
VHFKNNGKSLLFKVRLLPDGRTGLKVRVPQKAEARVMRRARDEAVLHKHQELPVLLFEDLFWGLDWIGYDV